MDETVIEDGMSRYGLRVLHLLRGGARPSRAMAEKVAEAEGGKLLLASEYEDELGFWHLMLAWRCFMGPMWVMNVNGKGESEAATWIEACGRAAEHYERRYGQWPNRAVVRNETMLPEGLEREGVRLEDGKGGPVAHLRFMRVNWMRLGDVGVLYEEA